MPIGVQRDVFCHTREAYLLEACTVEEGDANRPFPFLLFTFSQHHTHLIRIHRVQCGCAICEGRPTCLILETHLMVRGLSAQSQQCWHLML